MSGQKASAETAAITLNVYDGARQPIAAGTPVVVSLFDGRHQQVFTGLYSGPNIRIAKVVVHNDSDNFTVVVRRAKYRQGRICNLRLTAGAELSLDIMLTPRHARLDFSPAAADKLKANYPQYWQIIAAGAKDDAQAVKRWNDLISNDPLSAECLLNILTALNQYKFSDGSSPLQYYQGGLIWDETMAQDRFFAWVDPQYIKELEQGQKQGTWQLIGAPDILHPGATRAWKQNDLFQCNLNPTAHENDTKVMGGKTYILMETDIDYYPNPLSHFFQEVVPNMVTDGLTDPQKVYQLRWNSGSAAGLPAFCPPYVLEPAHQHERLPRQQHNRHRDLRNLLSWPSRWAQ